MDADETQEQVTGDEKFQSVEIDSGSDEAFMALHDPVRWLETRGIEVAAGKKVTTTIVNHEHGLRKKIIKVDPERTEAGNVKLTFTKAVPTGDDPEPIGYRFENEGG